MATGLCPQCEESVDKNTLEPAVAVGPRSKEIRALAMLCPNCNKILAVNLHPIVLAAMAAPPKKKP
jgi:uncharacterized protein with PIN domain